MIRKANIDDCSRLTEINVFAWRCAYIHFIPLDILFKQFTLKIRENKFIEILSIENNPGKTYVFEEENIVKAYVIIGEAQDEDKDNKTFELWAIFVDPIFQRKGIGKQLVDFGIKEAKEMNKEEIVLWVFERNINSIKFYKKMGFIIDGKTKKHEKLTEEGKEIRMFRKI